MVWPFDQIKKHQEAKRLANESLDEIIVKAQEVDLTITRGHIKRIARINLLTTIPKIMQLKRQNKLYTLQTVSSEQRSDIDYIEIGQIENPDYKPKIRQRLELKKQLGEKYPRELDNPQSPLKFDYEEKILGWEDTPIEEWVKRNTGKCPDCSGSGKIEKYIPQGRNIANGQPSEITDCYSCDNGSMNAEQCRAYHRPNFYGFETSWKFTKPPKTKAQKEFKEISEQQDLDRFPAERLTVYLRVNS